MSGHLMRLVWVQTALRARAAGLDVLLNTVPEAIIGSRIPQITVVHDLLPLYYPAEYPRQQYYFRSLVPRVLQSSRVIVADSESTRRDVVQSYGVAPDKVRVVYPGYDPANYAPNGGDRLARRHRGVLRPLRGQPPPAQEPPVPPRRPRHPPPPPAGEARDPRRRPARLRARRAPARRDARARPSAVSFQGYAAEGELRDLYAGAACLVLPSLREGFGLPVLEAMACGTPVVTSASSSLPEVGGDAALRVDPHDAIDLADAMYRVLTEAHLREDLIERGPQVGAGIQLAADGRADVAADRRGARRAMSADGVRDRAHSSRQARDFLRAPATLS